MPVSQRWLQATDYKLQEKNDREARLLLRPEA